MKNPKQSNVEKAANINDFGRTSFVTHTTGLKERIQKVEHLFKLKKDGKTVGYLLFEDGFIQISVDGKYFHYLDNQNPTGSLSYNHHRFNIFIDWDSIHPFVTKDKNGKDVFADDEVVSNKDDPILEVRGIVKYRPRFADYIIEGTQRYGIKNTDIELIED